MSKISSSELVKLLSQKVDSAEDMEPLPSDRYVVESTDEAVNAGLEAVANGEVALVVLAGGQASRLGALVPKGTLELALGLHGFNNLFSLQAQQIRALEDRVFQKFNKKVSIPWIVLTSKSTEVATKEFMKDLAKELSFEDGKIIFIRQDEIPCFEADTMQPIMNGKSEMTAPNGNGGFFQAIRDELPGLRAKGIKYFHVYCVDNILCRVGDPAFIGHCIMKKADCAAKVVEKVNPHEKIGIIGVVGKKKAELKDSISEAEVQQYNALELDPNLKDKSVSVIEYMEISKEKAELCDPSNPKKLYFRAGNIAIHFFHIDFLSYVAHVQLPYHHAKKMIKHKNDLGAEVQTPGVKLEHFIFDVFPFSRNFLAYEVDREDEFAPLKNSDDAGVDCPSTCVEAYKRYQEKYAKA